MCRACIPAPWSLRQSLCGFYHWVMVARDRWCELTADSASVQSPGLADPPEMGPWSSALTSHPVVPALVSISL